MTLSENQTDVLIFVEDPGAANFVTDVPELLSRRGRTAHVVTSGLATAYLQQRGVEVDPLPSQCDLAALVARLAPRLIAVGTAENVDSFGLQLVAIAAARGIPSVGLVDSSTHLDYRFRGRSTRPLEFCPDTVIVPDTVCRDGFVQLGVSQQRLVVAGHPHWDHVRSVYRSLLREDRTALRLRLFDVAPTAVRTVVLFAAEISTGMNRSDFQFSDQYSLTGSGESSGRTEIVIEEFLTGVASRRMELHLVLRLHPKHAPQDLSQFYSEFDSVSQAEPPLDVLYAADIVVGMTSMLMIEAALMERPTLAILPRGHEATWLPTIAAGITPCASRRDAVRKEIRRLLEARPPAQSTALDCLFPSGALERVVATFDELLTS
jgi:hypothetical protein